MRPGWTYISWTLPGKAFGVMPIQRAGPFDTVTAMLAECRRRVSDLLKTDPMLVHVRNVSEERQS